MQSTAIKPSMQHDAAVTGGALRAVRLPLLAS
jgi:hypothetical protein